MGRWLSLISGFPRSIRILLFCSETLLSHRLKAERGNIAPISLLKKLFLLFRVRFAF